MFPENMPKTWVQSQVGMQAPGQEMQSACLWVVQRLDPALQSASALYLGPTRLIVGSKGLSL